MSLRRRLPLEHILIAGSVDDLDAIRALVALLPAKAYGQVLLEVPSADIGPDDASIDLSPPPRVIVTHVTPPATGAQRAGESAVVTRGVLLAEAVSSWAAEWMPAEPTLDRIVTMWIGGRGVAEIDELCLRLEHEPERF